MPIVNDYDLFIFDFDGTISTSTFLTTASTFFQMRYDIDNIIEHKENYGSAKIEDIKPEQKQNAVYSHLYDLYSIIAKPRLKEGALETLKLLKKKGKKVVIFSDSNRYRLMKEIKMLGILGYVDFVLSAESIKILKPNPVGLLLVIKKFKAKKNRSIYIGDMASDIFTAKFAGVTSCAVASGAYPYDLLKKAKPKYLFRDMNSFLARLS